MSSWNQSSGRSYLVVALCALLGGCAAKIGDSCSYDIDCSRTASDRRCDKAQPGGYCTTFGCNANACPDEAVCVLYNAAVPGCTYDDRDPARVGRSFCMASCEDNDDCRDGYVCVDPKSTPWFASILDKNTSRKVCTVPVSYARTPSSAPVCGGGPPMSTWLDAGTFPEPEGQDAGTSDAEAPDASLHDASTTADAGAADAST